jgi:hypothetical protein
MSWTEIVDWLSENSSLLIYGVAGLMTGLFVISVLLRRRAAERAPTKDAPETRLTLADRAVTRVTGLLATAVIATGSWKVFGDILHLHWAWRIALFAFAESLIYAAWRRARRHIYRHAEMGNVGIIYGIALGSASVAALDAGSVPEVVLRFFAAFIASKMIAQELVEELDIYLVEHPDKRDGTRRRRSRIKWRLTPERVLNWLGLADATEHTVEEAERKLHIARLARTARRLHRLKARKGVAKWRITRVRRQLDRLAEKANEKLQLASDEAAIGEVRRQLAFLYSIEEDTSQSAVADLRPMAKPKAPQGEPPAQPQPARFYLDAEYEPRPAQKPAAALKASGVPRSASGPRKAAQRAERPAGEPVLLAPDGDWRRDAQGRIVGTIRNPARLVAGEVLVGEQLKADARRRVTQELANGTGRMGLGASLARQYEPPMSDRWGQERVAEVPVTDDVATLAVTAQQRAEALGPDIDDRTEELVTTSV